MRIEVRRRGDADPPVIDILRFGNAKGGGIACVHHVAEKIVIGIGNTAFKTELEVELAARADLTSRLQFEAPGSLIVVDKGTRTVEVVVDVSGCFPIFVQRTNTGIRLADQVRELSARSDAIDPVGLTEFLRFGYCIGDRTPFQWIRRIRPGEYARFLIDTPSEHYEDRSPLWTGSHPNLQPPLAVDIFCESLTQATHSHAPFRLMMSGGWDSRLLLAASLVCLRSAHPSLYFHGDTASREARIVRKMQTDAHLDAHFIEIRPDIFAPDQLEHFFGHFESVSFPFWHGIRQATPVGTGAVMAGIYGEVIGGHYGPPMALHGWRKWIDSAAWMAVPNVARRRIGPSAALARAREIYRQHSYPVPWYMHRDAWGDEFAEVHHAIESRIHAALDRYFARGAEEAHTLIEAFVTEHRGAQFIAAQLHSAAQNGGFLAPYANRSIMEIAASVPFQQKAFNRFSQAAIHALRPDLLRHPVAATLCNAGRPILMLEASRVMRKSIEYLESALIGSHSTAASRLSWVNFHPVVQDGILHDVVDSLCHAFWNKGAMHDYLRSVTREQSHPVTDAMMKVKTMDLHLTRPPPELEPIAIAADER